MSKYRKKEGSTPLSVHHVMRSGIWVFVQRIADRGLGLIRTIILARLLAPNDFGLMGIAVLTISLLEVFSQTGFRAALIQRKENIDDYLDTAWTVSIIRGIVLFAILYLTAPYIALFYENSKITLIIQVVAASFLLNGFRNIGVVYFNKELEFNKVVIFELIGTLVDLAVSISTALILKSVWSLIFGLLARNIVQLVMSYILHPYRPALKFELQRATELHSFGKWMFGLSVVVFLALRGDDIFVGKVLGITALGLYRMAFQISNTPTTESTQAISQVTFPAYSKIQDDISKLLRGFLMSFQLTALISIPLAVAIFLLAHEFTQVFLGEKWMPIVPLLKILIISGFIRSITATGGPLFQAVGRPDIDFKMNLARVAVMAITIYPLTMVYGMSGIALSVLFAILATIPIWWGACASIIRLEFSNLLREVSPILIGAIIMGLAIYLAKELVGEIDFPIFIFVSLVGALIYFSIVYLACKYLRCGPLKNLSLSTALTIISKDRYIRG